MDDAPTRTRSNELVLRGGTLRLPDGNRVVIGPAPIYVGRSPSCGVVVDDPEVSAVHCELHAGARGVQLRDLESRNGTRLAGLRVESAWLDVACTIELGSSRLEFIPGQPEVVEVGESQTFGPLAGCSAEMRYVFRVLREVAPTDLGLLVRGETGTGKELVAQALHEASARAKGPFVVVDCAAIPPSLAESTLFGHERGSFTSANERRDGAFQEADGGTLFFDELAELPLELQPKLLRALAERKVKRVGGSYQPVDVRVVAAARRDFTAMVNDGRFRSDLFFRIAQVTVTLPPLRERLQDIPLLIDTLCERIQRPERTTSVVDAIARLLPGYGWPGNVRELANITSVLAKLPPDSSVASDVISLGLAAETAPASSAYAQAKQHALNAFERRFFADLTRICASNITEIARRSGLSRQYVRAYLRKHGLA